MSVTKVIVRKMEMSEGVAAVYNREAKPYIMFISPNCIEDKRHLTIMVRESDNLHGVIRTTK